MTVAEAVLEHVAVGVKDCVVVGVGVLEREGAAGRGARARDGRARCEARRGK